MYKEGYFMKQKLLICLLCLTLLLNLTACVTGPTTGTAYNTAPPLLTDCDHTDDNSDLLCDRCEGSVLVSVDFWAINDLHGRFDDTDDQPGLDELSTYLEKLDDSTNIFLASGDMWQGSAESNLTYGAMMTEWMNAMDFAAMTLGNHEFDWGEEYIEANEALAEFPFLAINIYDRTTNSLVDYCEPSILIERSGLQIGIIGAIGDCYSSISSDKTQDIYFKTGKALTDLVKAEAQRLRSLGADIIVYSLHDGGNGGLGNLQSYYDLSLSDGYVDLVFEGHSHSRYSFQDTYGVYHIQGGAENDGISKANITYNLVTGDIDTTVSFVSSNTYDDCEDHPIVDSLLDKYKEQIAQGSKVLGNNIKGRNSEFLRKLVAQLYYQVGVERWGKEYDIALGGGFLSIRNPYELAAGEVTYADLYSLFPFDNNLVLCSIQGSDLQRRFLETDNKNYFIYHEDLGQIDPNGTYYVIVDSYSSTYAANRLTEIARYDAGVYARDLLADYIAGGGLAGTPIPDTYTLTDIPTALQICSQLSPGETTQESYFIQGKIVSIASAKYGNMTIEDENGNRIYIYGLNDRNGKRYDKMEYPPQLGDTVILYGQLQNYVPANGDAIYEMVQSILIESR